MSAQQTPQNQKQQLTIQAAHHSGPIPPPAMLEEYNKIVPNAAERIIKMAEDQSAHRIKIESQVVNTDTRNTTLGIVCALIIMLGVLGLAAYALKLGQPIAAGFIGALGIGSIVGSFIYGTRTRQLEREKRFNK